MNFPAIVAFAGMIFLTSQAQAQERFIAGLNPSQRPEGAPVVTEVVRDAAWFKMALRGVEEPVPASLDFLRSQGNWFTPFIHPGMLDPYDIRGLHKIPVN